jgi:hypothetical protein
MPLFMRNLSVTSEGILEALGDYWSEPIPVSVQKAGFRVLGFRV